MDQSLVHTFSWGNSYGPMVLKVLLKFPPTLVLVHGWLLPAVSSLEKQYHDKMPKKYQKNVQKINAALLLTVGSFLLTAELLCSQLCCGAFSAHSRVF